MKRRNFLTGLAGIFAAGVAPAIVSREIIMPVRALWTPQPFKPGGDGWFPMGDGWGRWEKNDATENAALNAAFWDSVRAAYPGNQLAYIAEPGQLPRYLK